jgi:glycosyltransferase involved in cell wall biosynthesis
MFRKIKDQLVRNNIRIKISDGNSLELFIETLFAVNRIRRTSIFYSMWETSILKKGSVPLINQANMVIVPSVYNKILFRENKIDKPIAVVPLGVDTDAYYQINKLNQHVFTFGIAGTYHNRKNIPFVINTFKKVFAGMPAVLKLKTNNDVKNVKFASMFNYYPQVQTESKNYTDHEMCKWYNSLDVFISCAHSEGFGLHQLEAMACGVPVISPKFGGVTEYFDESVGYCVDYKMASAKNNSEPYYDGEWCDATEESLADKMMIAYNNREETYNLGLKARERALLFTWDQTAIKLIKKINNYCSTRCILT